MDIENVRKRIRNKKNKMSKEKTYPKVIKNYILKILVVALLTISTLIALKINPSFKTEFHKQIFSTNLSFAVINKWYQDNFGSPLPFKNFFKEPLETVFNEKLNYKEINMYKDGISLKVEEQYLVPSIESGMVIFTGEKDGYGKVIIIEQTNGVEVWYGNFDTINVKIYDYIEKGTYLGQILKNELYLVFMKDGIYLPYENYL